MQQEKKIRCGGCKQPLRQEHFKNHIRSCALYQGVLLKCISKIPNNTQTIMLKFYNAQLQVAQQMLQKKIQESELKNFRNVLDEINRHAYNAFSGRKQQKIEKLENNRNVFSPHTATTATTQNRKMVNIDEKINYPSLNVKIQPSSCKKCGKKIEQTASSKILFRNPQCWHQFCKECVLKYIDQQYAKCFGCLPCLAKDCKKIIPQKQIKQLVGQKYKKYEEEHQHILRKMINIIQCAKCHFQFEFSGSQNKFLCPNKKCKISQCKQCKQYPYHNGQTCKDYRNSKNKVSQILIKYKYCRFCTKQLTNDNLFNSQHEALQGSCNSTNCSYLANLSCIKMLKCGHPCHGIKAQEECLPCLEPSCYNNVNQLCKICNIQTLDKSICIKIGCGHIFHQKCLQKRYLTKSNIPRINFDYCLCPICKKFISAKIPNQYQLSKIIKNSIQSFNKIQLLAIQRLNLQQRNTDPKILDPKSIFYQKQYQYSMAIYAYYQCYKCKKPYFGGRRNCMDPLQKPKIFDNWKKQQLICPHCTQTSIPNCQKHERKYAEFKCKFCCNTAVWYSNKTHFCDSCYSIKPHILGLSKNSLPKCEGLLKCPIGGNHYENGEQKVFGCMICKNKSANTSQLKKYWFF